MIHDTFQNAGAYLASEDYQRAIREIQNLLKKPFQPGKITILEDQLYLISTEYETHRLSENSKMECHRNYIDIMYMVDGDETIYYKPRQNLRHLLTEYDPQIDAQLSAVEDDCIPLRLQSGQMAVFFPQDAHAPGHQNGADAGKVRKIIGKLAYPIR